MSDWINEPDFVTGIVIYLDETYGDEHRMRILVLESVVRELEGLLDDEYRADSN